MVAYVPVVINRSTPDDGLGDDAFDWAGKTNDNMAAIFGGITITDVTFEWLIQDLTVNKLKVLGDVEIEGTKGTEIVIKITDVGSGFTPGETVGKYSVFSADTSGAGASNAGEIDIVYNEASGTDYDMIFRVRNGAGTNEVLKLNGVDKSGTLAGNLTVVGSSTIGGDITVTDGTDKVTQSDGGFVRRSVGSHGTTPNGDFVQFPNASPNNVNEVFWRADDSSGIKAAIRSNGGFANVQSNDADLSDRETKHKIRPLDSGWDLIKDIEVVESQYKDQTNDNDNIGCIAQQVPERFQDTEAEDGFTRVFNKDIYFSGIRAIQENRTLIIEQGILIENLNAQSGMFKESLKRIEVLEDLVTKLG